MIGKARSSPLVPSPSMARLRMTSWNDGRSSSDGSSASASRRARAPQRQRRLGLDEVAGVARRSRRPAPRRRARRRRNSPSAATTARRTRGCVSSSAASKRRRARPRAASGRARAPPPRARPRSRRRASAVASAATPAGSGARRARAPPRRDRSPGARPRAAAATAAAALVDAESTSGRRRRDRRSPASGRAGRRNSKACVASATVTRSSRSLPVDLEAHARRELEQRRLGGDRLLLRHAQRADLASSSHSQRASSSGWPARAIQRSKNSSTLRPVASSMARARSRVSTEPRACLRRVVRDRAPERVVAQLVPQHVQHAPALLVQVASKRWIGSSYCRQTTGRW